MTKYRNSLNKIVFSGCLILVILLCVCMTVISFFSFRNEMLQQQEAHLSDIIALTLSRIDAEDLKQCIETGKTSEKYDEMLLFMDQARQNYSLESIVIVRPAKIYDNYDVFYIASGLLEQEREGVNLKALPIPCFGDSMKQYMPPDFPFKAYHEMNEYKETHFNISVSDFGTIYTGVVSIVDENGYPVALLSAGLSLDFLKATMIHYLHILIPSVSVLCIMFICIMMFWFKKRIINPLNAIENAASEFEEKSRILQNPEAFILDIPEIHTNDELESLSNALSMMSVSMKKYAEDLIDSASKMSTLEEDLYQSRKIALQLGQLATKDSLTGIRNKTAYDEEVRKTNEDLKNGSDKFGLVMIDLNFLKKINDTYGHEKGDLAIIALCHLTCTTFDHSPVFRVGGDEFVVILKDSDYENSEKLVNSFIAKIDKLAENEELKPWEKISAAIGYSLFDKNTDTNCDDVFRRADENMYKHKKKMKAVRK